jgi:hypothetical protein
MVANKGGSWLVSSNSKIINKVKKNGFVGGLNTLFGSQVMIPKKCFIFCLKFTYIYRCSVRDSDHKAFISSLVVGSTREQATARPERARKRLESRSALAWSQQAEGRPERARKRLESRVSACSFLALSRLPLCL